MTDTSAPTVTARRFLHCCYCCRDADAASRLFVERLGLDLRMRSAGARLDGSQLGFAGGVETDACFVYDARGPRVSPAIEVQAWIDPPTVGSPYPDTHHIGFQALGLAVPDLAATADDVVREGCKVVGRITSGAPVLADTTIVRDPTGVALDLVEETTLDRPSQLVHLRATCVALDRSLLWYSALGFETVDVQREVVTTGEPFGIAGDCSVSVGRLRLPDEPFELVLTEWHEPRSHGRVYPTANHAGLYRFAIAVDDTRATYEALAATGFPVAGPPEVVALPGTNVPDMWIAFLRDPDGMTIELVERPRSAFR